MGNVQLIRLLKSASPRAMPRFCEESSLKKLITSFDAQLMDLELFILESNESLRTFNSGLGRFEKLDPQFLIGCKRINYDLIIARCKADQGWK